MTRQEIMVQNTERFSQIRDKYSANYVDNILYFEDSFEFLLTDHNLEEKPFTGVKQILKKFAGEYIQNSMQNECMLNFASAKYPGGGVTHGSIAQEEDICRNTLLYFYINGFDTQYYSQGKFIGSNQILNENFIIYSRNVATVKPDLSLGHYNDYITAAAPDLRYLNGFDLSKNPNFKKELQITWANRILAVLAAAKLNGAQNLVLGPWGCGVFQNDPNFVFFCFDQILKKYGGNFRRITFLCPTDEHYEIFKKYVSL